MLARRPKIGTANPLGNRYYAGVAVRDAAGLKWIAGNHQGSGTSQIDPTTLAITARRFMPYGETRGTQPTWLGTKGYVGGTKDATTGLTHLGAREYDPTVGRFISRDPIIVFEDSQQINGYAYSHNSPITFSDPSGLRDCDFAACDAEGNNDDTSSPTWQMPSGGAVGGGRLSDEDYNDQVDDWAQWSEHNAVIEAEKALIAVGNSINEWAARQNALAEAARNEKTATIIRGAIFGYVGSKLGLKTGLVCLDGAVALIAPGGGGGGCLAIDGYGIGWVTQVKGGVSPVAIGANGSLAVGVSTVDSIGAMNKNVGLGIGVEAGEGITGGGEVDLLGDDVTLTGKIGLGGNMSVAGPVTYFGGYTASTSGYIFNWLPTPPR